jgi:cytochrome c oxidase cbb3-type subunit III
VTRLASAVLVVGAMAAIACDRDPRVGGQRPAAVPPPEVVAQVPLTPGGMTARRTMQNPFAGDTRALAEGERLYHWMNCSGCHFNGGGGMGPPLMDDDWIYGGAPAQIYDSIAAGRANGMPVYGDKLASEQIWQIVVFVESLNPDRSPGGVGAGEEPAGASRR